MPVYAQRCPLISAPKPVMFGGGPLQSRAGIACCHVENCLQFLVATNLSPEFFSKLHLLSAYLLVRTAVHFVAFSGKLGAQP